MRNISEEDTTAAVAAATVTASVGGDEFCLLKKILNYVLAWTTGLTATLVIIITLAIHLVITTTYIVISNPLLWGSILAVIGIIACIVIIGSMVSVPILILCSPVLLVVAGLCICFSPLLILIGVPILFAIVVFALVTFSSATVIAIFALLICGIVFGVVGLLWDWPRLFINAMTALWYKMEDDNGEGNDSPFSQLGNFVKNFIATLWRYLIPSFPAVDADLSGFPALLFREPCKYHKPKNASPEEYKKEVWIYINGIATTRDIAETNRDLLFEMFGRPIHLIHNPTDSILVDLIECLAWKVGLLGTLTNLGSLVYKQPEDVLKKQLTRFLNQSDVEKVVLIAHSQGTIVTGNALTDLLQGPTCDKMKSKLEVYNFATCAHNMPGGTIRGGSSPSVPGVKSIENISNGGDIVAWLGDLFQKAFYLLSNLWIDANGKSLHITGKSVVETFLWGHLLNTHYLKPMQKHGKYSGSVLVRYMNQEKERQRTSEQGSPPSPSPSSASIVMKEKMT
mmetsp:Transcript_17677/g.26483  ORF Transcript_17677/g.26483 Transcript_17677/m.26483 type:complete len:510 (+) Transcript_17677:129-1658(+)